MTALLFDLGNSRWKAAVSQAGEIDDVVDGGYDELTKLQGWLTGHARGLGAAWLASVVDPVRTDAFLTRMQAMLKVDIERVRSTDPMPNLRSGYRKPEQLGIDRLLAMVAARARHSGPMCVVDAGSAVTVDFVDAQGQHLGGFILPGERMFRDCLLANTSIPRDADIENGAMLGCDTPTAVALGGRYAVAGIVERFTSGGAALFPGEATRVFVGGGDADRLLDLMPVPCTKLDHLVLRGLAVLAAGIEE